VRYTLYPDTGHDAWTETYSDPALYSWLLAQQRPGG
jgi:predicted peptidase